MTVFPKHRVEQEIVIGLDVGGTKSHAVAYDRDMRPLAEFREPTLSGNAAAILQSVESTVAAVLDRLPDHQILGIGVGVPGLVDEKSGSFRQAVNLSIGDESVPLADRLSLTYGVPCRVGNDVNVAALGSYQFLNDQSIDTDLAYLSVGTGLAAGIVLSGQLHRGGRGVAGEIGHLPVQPDGPVCECGLTGCLEAVASGAAMSRLWPTASGRNAAADLFEASASGDGDARVLVEQICDYLALATYLLAVTFDVDMIVLGGGVSDLREVLLGEVRAGLARREATSEFVKALQLQDRVILKPNRPVGALGAAMLVLEPPRP